MKPAEDKELPDVRITDPYVRGIIKRIRDRHGDRTATATAGRLIIERAAQLEIIEQKQPAGVG